MENEPRVYSRCREIIGYDEKDRKPVYYNGKREMSGYCPDCAERKNK